MYRSRACLGGIIILALLLGSIVPLVAGEEEWTNAPDTTQTGSVYYMESVAVDKAPYLRTIPDPTRTTVYNRAGLDAGETLVLTFPMIYGKNLYQQYRPDVRPELSFMVNPQGQYNVTLSVKVLISYNGNIIENASDAQFEFPDLPLKPVAEQKAWTLAKPNLGLRDIEYGSFQVRISRMDEGNRTLLFYCHYDHMYSWLRMPYTDKEKPYIGSPGEGLNPYMVMGIIGLIGAAGALYLYYQRSHGNTEKVSPEPTRETVDDEHSVKEKHRWNKRMRELKRRQKRNSKK